MSIQLCSTNCLQPRKLTHIECDCEIVDILLVKWNWNTCSWCMHIPAAIWKLLKSVTLLMLLLLLLEQTSPQKIIKLGTTLRNILACIWSNIGTRNIVNFRKVYDRVILSFFLICTILLFFFFYRTTNQSTILMKLKGLPLTIFKITSTNQALVQFRTGPMTDGMKRCWPGPGHWHYQYSEDPKKNVRHAKTALLFLRAQSAKYALHCAQYAKCTGLNRRWNDLKTQQNLLFVKVFIWRIKFPCKSMAFSNFSYNTLFNATSVKLRLRALSMQKGMCGSWVGKIKSEWKIITRVWRPYLRK